MKWTPQQDEAFAEVTMLLVPKEVLVAARFKQCFTAFIFPTTKVILSFGSAQNIYYLHLLCKMNDKFALTNCRNVIGSTFYRVPTLLVCCINLII